VNRLPQWIALVLVVIGFPVGSLFANEASSDPAPADGSLVFLENSNYFVERYTEASIGHVAVVIRDGGRPLVYEATPGRVRKVTWDDYLLELGKLNQDRSWRGKKLIAGWVLAPKTPYSSSEISHMRRYLESQIARRYSILGYLRGQQSDGVHCAELASHTISFGGRFDIDDCYKQTPSSVMALAQSQHRPKTALTIPEPAKAEPWCSAACRRWSNYWMMARWSIREVWHYAWAG
jgi:hypothetical protein